MLPETLHAFGAQFVSRLTSPASLSLQRIIVGEGERFPELGVIFYERGPRPIIEGLSTYLKDQMHQGRLRRADPSHAAVILISMLQFPQQLRLWNTPAAEEGRLLERATDSVNIFMQAYAPDTLDP